MKNNYHLWLPFIFIQILPIYLLQCDQLEDSTCVETQNFSIFCSGYSSNFVKDFRIKSLTICNYQNSFLDVTNILRDFPAIEKLTIENSNISHLRGKFPVNNSLKTLNLTGLNLKKVRSYVLSGLEGLRVLDLRQNRLNHLHPAFVTLANRLETLYLDGNEWNCAKNLDWALYLNSSIVQDLQNLTCFGDPFSEKPLKQVAMFISNMRGECPEPCECTLSNVVENLDDLGGGLIPMIQVNCSARGLTFFPETLPINTSTLLMNRNRIRSIGTLIRNRHYRGISDIFLDDNLITSVDELEGAHWLQNFRVFSLRSNMLSQIPTYAWDNALKRNHNAIHLFLGLNPWRCDCFFTPGFQELLLKYQTIIQDTEEIRCARVEGDENSLKTIVDLSRISVCSAPAEYSIHALDMLNIILATLIVLILSKLAYDYYKFKKTGQLPWIVTKIP